jgi:benzoyl-CoA reductase/2-hydroxyglutaryl-CoA dehydratase subunit BcrC/BadD/HgdB
MEKVGYFCTFTPKELIRAAGFLPVRVLARNDSVSLANTHIQSYCCSQVRGSLERMLNGELRFQGVVFTRSCDSLMRLADIWDRNSEMKVFSMEFPTKIDHRAKEFLIEEFYSLKETLENWSGREIDEKNLSESIRIYSELENLLKKLFEIEPDYHLILNAETETPEEVIRLLRLRFEETRSKKERKKDDTIKKALVTGSVCPIPEVMELIRDTGFRIIDDLCTGSRFFTTFTKKKIPDTMDELMDFLAEKYLKKAPCPTKNYPEDGRFKYLIEKAEDVDAVIFLLLKFCEPHFFDYPQLKEKFEEMGKKTLLIELEFPISTEQLRTRLEAFYEMLEE